MNDKDLIHIPDGQEFVIGNGLVMKYEDKIFKMVRVIEPVFTVTIIKPTTMKNPKKSKQKVIASKTKTGQTKVVAANKPRKAILQNVNIPVLTSKQKKVLQTPIPMLKDDKYAFKGKFKLQDKPLIAGWEDSIISTPTKRKKEVANQKPKTLAKFTNIAELKVVTLQKNEFGSVEICKNKITHQWHHRIKGNNGEILCQSECMHNRVDLISNLILIRNIL